MYVHGAAFASAKSMLALFNGAGSGRVLRLYGVWMIQNSTTVTTATLTSVDLIRCTNLVIGSGAAATVAKHDSDSETLPAAIVGYTGGTPTTVAADIFRRLRWSADEPAVSGATIDELQMLPFLTRLWDSGYMDSNVEPIVCPEGYGVTLTQPGANTNGTVDVYFEFTTAAT
jgi:hypothetical protein